MTENPQSIGEHLRKRRQELKITQKAVAEMIGVSEDSITGWENGRFEPQIQYYPKIIQFLGYNPFPFDDTTIGGKIKKYRFENGLSIKKLAKQIRVEERTLTSWENNSVIPNEINLKKIKGLV